MYGYKCINKERSQMNNVNFYLKKLEKELKVILKQAKGTQFNEDWNRDK